MAAANNPQLKSMAQSNKFNSQFKSANEIKWLKTFSQIIEFGWIEWNWNWVWFSAINDFRNIITVLYRSPVNLRQVYQWNAVVFNSIAVWFIAAMNPTSISLINRNFIWWLTEDLLTGEKYCYDIPIGGLISICGFIN